MCTGGAPQIPDPAPIPPAPAMPPPAPAAPPIPEPEAPMAPPTPVTGDKDAVGIKKRKSKRAQQQQASQGAGALRIPLSTGEGGAVGADGSGPKKGSLNIPK